MPQPLRTRGCCFTWNNYPEQYANILTSLAVDYVCYGKEIAPTTGTPHLQGYIHVEHPKTIGGFRRMLPGSHCTLARGTPAQNIDYCSKGGDFYESGIRPQAPADGGDLEIDRWTDAISSARLGHFESIPPDMYVRYYATWRRIHQDYMPRVPDLEGPCGIWIYGSAGSGKTLYTSTTYPDAYRKPRNQWWDGYQGESTVILDDVDKYDVALGGKLKHWADSYAFVAEVKGGSRRIRPSRLVVTSQYRIEDIWGDAETQEALGRRFQVVRKERGVTLILDPPAR